MSQLAPAKMRLWVEMWKEEVMASIPTSELKHKFHNQQVEKGRAPSEQTDGSKVCVPRGGKLL